MNVDHPLVLECESREPDLADPRVCCILLRFSAAPRDDYWLVSVKPPLLGQHFGLGQEMLDRLVLATRLDGYSILDADRYPIPVYVARVAEPEALTPGCSIGSENIILLLWGEVRATGIAVPAV